MSSIPKTQFEIIKVEEIDKNGKVYNAGVFQTFEQAYQEISKRVKGALLYEYEDDESPFTIEYYCPEIWATRFGSIHVISRHFRMSFSLFTYDPSQPLVTDGYYWRKDSRSKDIRTSNVH